MKIRPVDRVATDARAASFQTRSLKKEAKLEGLGTVISMIDLTTLEGQDSTEKVRSICQKAMYPVASLCSIPSVAAVCVYPRLVGVAKTALVGSSVKVASVVTAFPSGQASLPTRLVDVREAVDAGADEVDMVIQRGIWLAGKRQEVADEIAAVRDACGAAHLKVILETGELESYDAVRAASDLAIQAGADFIKTSTGKVPSAASLGVTLVMLESIRDHFLKTGEKVGMKPAGGISSAKLALHYLVMVKETLGDDWLTPDLFRFGASSLLNDVLLQIKKQQSGAYTAHYDVSEA